MSLASASEILIFKIFRRNGGLPYGRKHYIKVQGTLVEVNREVYTAYYSMERHARYLEEKDQRNGKVQYSDLDTDEMSGEEAIPDQETPSAEDIAISRILHEKLHMSLDLLPSADRKLLYAIYFDGLSERQISKLTGLSQRTVNRYRKKALCKLKKFFEK